MDYSIKLSKFNPQESVPELKIVQARPLLFVSLVHFDPDLVLYCALRSVLLAYLLVSLEGLRPFLNEFQLRVTVRNARFLKHELLLRFSQLLFLRLRGHHLPRDELKFWLNRLELERGLERLRLDFQVLKVVLGDDRL